MPGKPTTECEKQLIRERIAKGLTRREVAKEFYRSPDTISRIVGPRRPTVTKEQLDNARLIIVHMGYYTTGMISGYTGLSYSQLYKYFGAELSAQRADRRKRAIDALQTEHGKLTLTQIAKKLNCSRAYLYKILRTEPRFASRYLKMKREISFKKISQEQITEIIRLYQSRPKKTLTEIATRVGCSLGAARKYTREYKQKAAVGDL